MLAELRDDNKQLTGFMRETHALCDEHGDVASVSLLENWIDETEERTWFLFEAIRPGEPIRYIPPPSEGVHHNDADYVTPLVCWPSFATTTSSSRALCARRTRSVTSMETWPASVCLRTGSTRRRSAPGFSSRPAARASR